MLKKNFKHQPLDHRKASIRLLQIRADLSHDGLIQCSLAHTTIDETPYSCLSYRWGEPLPIWKILINGRPHHVGGNLYDFLDIFRQSTLNQATESIWIDALCIAQDDVIERNHQVTQMGKIFSTAQSVYVWLGKMPSIAPIVSSLKNWQHPTYKDRVILLEFFDLLLRYLYANEYWNRAWITQEFLLARHAIVFLDKDPMDLTDLLGATKSYCLLDYPSYKSSSFSRHAELYQKSTVIAGLPLLSILDRFRGKHCSLLQDRIFSVLSLCSPSSRVMVDYDQDLVLLACNVLAKSPDPLCLCEVMTLLRDLNLFVDPATKVLLGYIPRHLAWEGIYVDVDLSGPQLRNLDSSGRLFTRDHFVCPVLEELIVSCARKVMGHPPTITWPNFSSAPTEDTPFMVRELSQKTRLDLARSNVFTIETASPGLRKYTLRIPMYSIVETRIGNRGHCPTSKRGAPWYYQGSKFLSYKRIGDAFRKQHFLCPPASPTRMISFEDCFAIFESLYRSREIPQTWGLPYEENTFCCLLADLKKHMQGEATTIPTERLEAEIKVAKWSEPSDYGYGPCTFVCPRNSKEEKMGHSSGCAQ